MKIKKISLLFIVLVMAFVISGCSKGNNNVVVSDDKATSSPAKKDTNKETIVKEEWPVKGTSSKEIMDKLLLKEEYDLSIFKIFEEIKSPDNLKSAVLIGLDYEKTKECCIRPTAVFINNNGVLHKDYYFLKGALNFLYLEDIKWLNNYTLSFYKVVSSEGGKSRDHMVIHLDK